MLLIFYSSMGKEGLHLKDSCVLHMDGPLKKIWNFKVTKDKLVAEKALIFNNHSHKRFKPNKHQGA